MAAEREIKTVLTLDDASFTKGLKAATSATSAARAEMNAAVNSAGGLGKGFKKYAAQVTGLNKVLKTEKQQMAVLNKEYKAQQKELDKTAKALKKLQQEEIYSMDELEEHEKELKEAANAYATQSSKVDELRTKMANLSSQMSRDKGQLTSALTAPFKALGTAALAAVAAAAAALAKFTLDSEQSQNELKQSLNESQATFGQWSVFLEQEADTAWKNLGLSKSAYLSAATDIGNFLQEAGAPVEKSAEISAQVLEMAASLAQEYGVPITDVLNDIKEAANGSRTAMNRYGIQVTGTTVQQTAMTYGVNKSYDAMTDEEKQLYSVMTALNQSKAAQNDYKKRTDNITSASTKLSAAWENFKAGTGTEADVSEAAAGWASAFASEFTRNLSTMITLAPSFFTSFAGSFSQGWNDNVWPAIQGLFSQQFGIELPDWAAVYLDLKTAWEGVKGLFTGIAEMVFGIGMPDWAQIYVDLKKSWESVKNLFVGAVETVFGIKLPSWDEIAESWNQFWQNAYNNLPQWMRDILDFLGGGGTGSETSGLEQSIETMAELADTASGSLSVLSDAAVQAARSMSSGGAMGMEMVPFNFDSKLGIYRPHAGGAWNVPYNNYLARLHSGEMVLTADQARRYRSQAASGGVTYNDSAAIYIDKYNQYSGADTDALLQQMQMMQRRQRMGYGLA